MTARGQQMAKVRDLSTKIVAEQAITLQQRGIPIDAWKGMMSEAIVTVPEVLKCTDNPSLARAIRSCCRDGLLPDGKDAVILPAKGGKAKYVPMVTGLKKLIYKALNADIKSGYIVDGDDYEIVEAAGEDPVIRVRRKQLEEVDPHTQKDVIAAWVWCKVPGQTAFLIVLDKNDLARAKAASGYADGPWKTWPGRMAEKSAVKSLMNRMRYMIPDGSQLATALEGDEEYVEGEIDEPVAVDLGPDEDSNPPDDMPPEQDDTPDEKPQAEADSEDLWPGDDS